MDFKDQIKQLGDKALKLKDSIPTEEATKTALIMPFIQCLGYDVFNPKEVIPEFITDYGAKNIEKVDYAILKNDQPILIIECKWHGEKLEKHYTQLHKYFHLTKARFAILTNGFIYNFYTDLANANKMDEKPFLSFDITDIRDAQVEELKKFHKSYFEIDKIVSTASALKYTNEIKAILSKELNEPSESFVKFFVSQVYDGRATEKVMEQFTELVKKSGQQLLSDIITDRLKTALKKEDEAQAAKEQAVKAAEALQAETKIETTAEELEAYYIVKAILRKKVDSARIVYRDAQSYFAILLDDNNRKPLCRLHLNGTKKYIGIFSADDKEKIEKKSEISSIDDVYKFASQLESIVEYYDKLGTVAK